MAKANRHYICRCGNQINAKRALLGYNNCIECGEVAARQITNQRNRSVMPMHKSNYFYVGGSDLNAMKKNVRDLTGKSGT